MARKSQDLRRVEARDNELAARIEQLELELADLRDERQKIKTAKEVLEELAGIGPTEPGEPAEPADDYRGTEDVLADLHHDIADLTIADMALDVLASGPPEGLTSNQILEAIRATHMPSLQRSSLSPPLSRLKRKEQIDLVGDRWRLTAVNEGST